VSSEKIGRVDPGPGRGKGNGGRDRRESTDAPATLAPPQTAAAPSGSDGFIIP
jgi:hypothetical protein